VPEFGDFENNGISLDDTGMFYQIELPAAMRFLNLGSVIPAFMEESLAFFIPIHPWL
jgi:hypothetical protein